MAAMELVFVALAGVSMAAMAKALSHRKLSPEVYEEKSRRISKWAEIAAEEAERERRVRAKQGGYRRALDGSDVEDGASLLRAFATRLRAEHGARSASAGRGPETGDGDGGWR